jgi:hypothetical protein
VTRLAVILAIGLLAAGCGDGSRRGERTKTQPLAVTTSTAPAPTRTRVTPPSPAPAEGIPPVAAIRRALAANHQLVVRVLWTNRIPSAAGRSTGGPALAALRASAQDRGKKRVRVKMIRDDYRIISVRFESRRTRASAVAEWTQRVVASRLDGSPSGRPISLHERATIELRRASPSRFVVWKVTLAR